MAWALVSFAAPASAEAPSSRSPSGALLHKRLPRDPQLSAGSADAPVIVYDPDSGLPPEAGEPLGPPGSSAPPPSDELVYSATSSEDAGDSLAQDTSEEVALDRKTGKEGMLEYHAVFDPEVVPFKRNNAKDAISAAGTLTVASGELSRVPIGGTAQRGRELFWGSVLVELDGSSLVPLPSVAPDSRILQLESAPAAPGLSVWKDGADNFYLQGQAPERLRVQFLMDAPSAYFGRSLPENIPLAGARDGLDMVPPPVPEGIRARAALVWRAVGVSASDDYAKSLTNLVGYFRSFEPGDPPPEGEDLFVDIALGKRGVCRHRSHAFVLTAQALGIAARYVSNEAHVFVEVWVPGASPGWMRVDLGGGALGLDVHGGADRSLHVPAQTAPFDWAARGEGDDPGREGGTAQGDARGGGRRMAGADAVRGLPSEEGGEREGGAPHNGSSPSHAAPGLPARGLDESAGDGRIATVTTIDSAEPNVMRGSSTQVTGSCTREDGAPVVGASVSLFLWATHETAERARLLGGAKTDTSGVFRIVFPVPADLDVGRYRLVARMEGDETLGPSESEP